YACLRILLLISSCLPVSLFGQNVVPHWEMSAGYLAANLWDVSGSKGFQLGEVSPRSFAGRGFVLGGRYTLLKERKIHTFSGNVNIPVNLAYRNGIHADPRSEDLAWGCRLMYRMHRFIFHGIMGHIDAGIGPQTFLEFRSRVRTFNPANRITLEEWALSGAISLIVRYRFSPTLTFSTHFATGGLLGQLYSSTKTFGRVAHRQFGGGITDINIRGEYMFSGGTGLSLTFRRLEQARGGEMYQAVSAENL
ncbi:MAG: hypothetical protein P8Y60_19025, partial [Calditrichota bacterium]